MTTRITLGLAAVALAGGGAFGQGVAAPQAAYLSHPLGVKPEHGGYMICVKSYTGPQSKGLAEALCEHVRTTHQAAAYLFEYGGQQRAEEEARQARARQAQIERNAPFLQAMAEERKKAAAEGRAFYDDPVMLKVQKVSIPEQWAVLVGGFPSEEVARRALDVVRKWPPPAERFMDQQFAVSGSQRGGTYINPFAAAMVVPNPAVKKATGPAAADPALIKLNSEEPLSLLRTTKGYTLLVKGFNMRTATKDRDEEPGVFDRLLGRGDDAAKQLQVYAHDARVLAEALRRPEMHKAAQEAAGKIAAQYGKPPFQVPPLTAYMLHTRTGSIVTVGEFTGEDDPDLIATGRILQYMEFIVKFKDGRPDERKRMFDNVIPIPIPRPQ